jgi:hypothetical protein
VDAKQVGLQGISRYGKEALVTLAYDPRFAIAYVASSGLAGAGLYRRNFGEILANVAGWTEYHWMAGNFVKYASDPLTAADLPVDGHLLIALCAPRPVLITVGSNTGPVYALLGDRPLAPAAPTPNSGGTPAIPPSALPAPQSAMPPPETALTGGALAFRQHNGGHSDAPNWPAFLDMAARYYRSPVHKTD